MISIINCILLFKIIIQQIIYIVHAVRLSQKSLGMSLGTFF